MNGPHREARLLLEAKVPARTRANPYATRVARNRRRIFSAECNNSEFGFLGQRPQDMAVSDMAPGALDRTAPDVYICLTVFFYG